MYFGEGAGVRRRHIKGELDKKMRDPIYKKHFEQASSQVNKARSVKRAYHERHARDVAANVMTVVKKVGPPIAIVAASAYYIKNKSSVDRTINNAFKAARIDPQLIQKAVNFSRGFRQY